MYSIQYQTKTIPFEVIRKPRMKNTYIQVTAEGVLVKTNKSTSMKSIEAFVEQKAGWILKHLETQAQKAKERELKTGSKLYYLGQAYEMEILHHASLKKMHLRFDNERFVFEVPQEPSQDELLSLLDAFYKQEAQKQIEPMVAKWSTIMQLLPTHVSYRKAKTRWGSCSGRNRLSFNYYLMKLPLALIEYVVVHELAHIEHKNHSEAFWGLVEQYMEDYQERKKALRAFEKLI